MPKTKKQKDATHHSQRLILTTVFLDMLALGLILPVFPRLILNFMGGNSTATAEVLGGYVALGGLMEFIFFPIMGALSNCFGRRTSFLISSLGTGMDYAIMALAPTLGWLLGSRVISSLTTSNLSTAFAQIADSTPSPKKETAFSRIGTTFSVGLVLGLTLGGLLGGFGPRVPFWMAAGLCAINFFFRLFVLPESLSKSRRVKWSWKLANPLNSPGFIKTNQNQSGSAGVYFGFKFLMILLAYGFGFYVISDYHWSAPAVGCSLAGLGLGLALVQNVMLKRNFKRLSQ
jgi:DHA1 family tetracycline resistance protein-like MFS transporter